MKKRGFEWRLKTRRPLSISRARHRMPFGTINEGQKLKTRLMTRRALSINPCQASVANILHKREFNVRPPKQGTFLCPPGKQLYARQLLLWSLNRAIAAARRHVTTKPSGDVSFILGHRSLYDLRCLRHRVWRNSAHVILRLESDKQCLPRHRMPFYSRNEVLQCRG